MSNYGQSKKYRIGVMFSVIASYLTINYFLTTTFSDSIPYKNVIYAFWSTFNIDCMAIGGIFAILLFQKNKLLKIFQNEILFYLTIILTIFLMIKGVYIPKFHYEFYSVLFGIIILNFSSNPKIKISLENKVFNYLGSISYGLYMYHSIGIVLAIKICIGINIVSN